MALKIGLQLYSVRNSMAVDPLATIENVGKLGYKYIEFANHNAKEDFGCGFGVPAEVMKEKLDSYGMKAVSAHISPLELDNVDKVIEYYSVLGCKNLVKSMDVFESSDDVKRKAEAYNLIGERLKKYGMSYLYHNHFQEFQKFDGKYVLDIMRENVDPSCVGFQLDTFWVMRGGADPIEILKRFGSAVKLVHQKDFAKDIDIPVDIFSYTDPNQNIDVQKLMDILSTPFNGLEQKEAIVEVGTGQMDIQSIIQTAQEYTDAEYIILEQDFTKHDEIESIKISMESFRKFSGVLWE